MGVFELNMKFLIHLLAREMEKIKANLYIVDNISNK